MRAGILESWTWPATPTHASGQSPGCRRTPAPLSNTTRVRPSSSLPTIRPTTTPGWERSTPPQAILIVPSEFTRDELRALLSKARALSQYGLFDDTKRDLLVDLAETLDLLDALAAREEADLRELEETITEHMGSAGMHVTHNSPPCGPGCPYHSRALND